MATSISTDKPEIYGEHPCLSFLLVTSRAFSRSSKISVLGNAILVALIELLESNRDALAQLHWTLYPWYFLALLTSLEVLVILIALLWYLGKTIESNLCLSQVCDSSDYIEIQQEPSSSGCDAGRSAVQFRHIANIGKRNRLSVR
jgi:hypothetical protein